MADEKLIELGKRVKMIRRELHISQKDFAAKINISGSFLSEIEAGKSKPGYDFFYNASRVCNVSIPYVLHGVGEMFTDIDYKPDMTSKEPEDENLESLDELLWYAERSALFKNTVLSHASKFLYDNEEAMKKEMEKYNKKKSEKKMKVL